MSFQEWAEKWEVTTVGLQPSTRDRDLDYLERYILPTFVRCHLLRSTI
jgi:hypothetical protein